MQGIHSVYSEPADRDISWQYVCRVWAFIKPLVSGIKWLGNQGKQFIMQANHQDRKGKGVYASLKIICLPLICEYDVGKC